MLAKIMTHYRNAKENHPYFCDRLPPVASQNEIRDELNDARDCINDEIDENNLSAFTLALCELLELAEAISMGDIAAAVEEAYDCIAVLLRVIDVLEGRQELGNPKKGKRK